MNLSTKSKAYMAAAKDMDFYAVCLVGWDAPRPSDFGDNKGVWPVKIVIRKKESEAAKDMDQESPHVPAVVLEYVLVQTYVRATRLKDALNEVLLGQQETQSNPSVRKSFRNVVDCWCPGDDIGRALWWAVCLDEARCILAKGATEFEIFTDPDEAHRKINKRAYRGH